MICEFFVAGTPVPKARARVVRMGNRVRSYTPDQTVNYEMLVKITAIDAMENRAPSLDPLALELTIFVTPPSSWSEKRRTAAIWGDFMPTRKPDASNILKSIEDGMNGVVYRDDSQLCSVTVHKRYHDKPGVKVAVRKLDAKAAP